MSSEYRVVSIETWDGGSENSPLIRGGTEGGVPPFEQAAGDRGMIREGLEFESKCQIKSTAREENPLLRGDRR
jgi:hypothetical protein